MLIVKETLKEISKVNYDDLVVTWTFFIEFPYLNEINDLVKYKREEKRKRKKEKKEKRDEREKEFHLRSKQKNKEIYLEIEKIRELHGFSKTPNRITISINGIDDEENDDNYVSKFIDAVNKFEDEYVQRVEDEQNISPLSLKDFREFYSVMEKYPSMFPTFDDYSNMDELDSLDAIEDFMDDFNSIRDIFLKKNNLINKKDIKPNEIYKISIDDIYDFFQKNKLTKEYEYIKGLVDTIKSKNCEPTIKLIYESEREEINNYFYSANSFIPELNNFLCLINKDHYHRTKGEIIKTEDLYLYLYIPYSHSNLFNEIFK